MSNALTHLQRSLTGYFQPAAKRNPDPYRKDREWAKPVAAEYGIEIEKCDSGWNVWPPKALCKRAGWVDAHEGGHYCQDWSEIRAMVTDYAHDCGRAV